MSRKFIDDHVELLSTTDRLPGSTSTVFGPGHMFRDSVTGTRYVNLGTKDGALFGAHGVNRYELTESFRQTPGINADLASATEATRVPRNRDFEVVGTNMTSALATFADGGGITLTTAGANLDSAIVTPHLDTKQTAWAATKWNTNDRVVFETTLKTAASVAALTIIAGVKLTNTGNLATDDDQTLFKFTAGSNDEKWQTADSASGTDNIQTTSVVIAASTSYHLLIKVDTNRIPRYYINGVLVATGNALTADVDLIPYIGTVATTAAAKAITTRFLRMSKDLND